MASVCTRSVAHSLLPTKVITKSEFKIFNGNCLIKAIFKTARYLFTLYS